MPASPLHLVGPTRHDTVTAALADALDLDLPEHVLAEEFDFAPMLAARPGSSERFKRALERARSVSRKALAPSTLSSYRYHWLQYVAWCRSMGEDPLPGSPETVGTHLWSLAAGDLDDAEDLEFDDFGEVRRQALSPSTISLRLSAINKAHRLCRLPAPGDDMYCAAMIRSLRNELGRRQVGKDALSIELLRVTIDRLDAPIDRLRDQALITLASDRRFGATDLATLTWEHVGFEDHQATISVPVGRASSGRRRRVTIAASPAHASCPLRWLHRLAAASPAVGPVFCKGSGLGTDRFSDVGIAKATKRIARTGGLDPATPGIARLNQADLARTLRALATPTLIDIRDRSVLLGGFASAVRRSNLTAFTWSDFQEQQDDLVVLLRRSKTDRFGKGLYVHLPRGSNPVTCPVRAWQKWRTAVGEALGDDPMEAFADQPVYVPLGRHGGRFEPNDCGALRALDDESVNQIVKRRTAAAGLTGNFGAHSLRAGFVTTLWERGVPLDKIAEQTHHASLDTLRAYIRRIDVTRGSGAAMLGL